MRDAFGGAFMIKIFLIFIIVYVCFTALARNYAKAFKVKNKISSSESARKAFNEERNKRFDKTKSAK